MIDAAVPLALQTWSSHTKTRDAASLEGGTLPCGRGIILDGMSRCPDSLRHEHVHEVEILHGLMM